MKNLVFALLFLFPVLMPAQGYHPQTAASYTAVGTTGSNGYIQIVTTSGTLTLTGTTPLVTNAYAAAMDQGVATTDSPTFLSFSSDGGQIYSDGSGDLNVGGNLTSNGGMFYTTVSAGNPLIVINGPASNNSGFVVIAGEGEQWNAIALGDGSGYFGNGFSLIGVAEGGMHFDFGSGGFSVNQGAVLLTQNGAIYSNGNPVVDEGGNLWYSNGILLANDGGNLWYGNGAMLADGGGNLWLNNAFNATPIVPTGSLVIYDSTGTPYLIPAVPQ